MTVEILSMQNNGGKAWEIQKLCINCRYVNLIGGGVLWISPSALLTELVENLKRLWNKGEKGCGKLCGKCS